MEPVKIHEKKSGGWWVMKVREEPKETPPRTPVKQKSMSNLLSSRTNTLKKEQPPVPVRSNTTLSDVRHRRSNTVTRKRLPPTPSHSNLKNPTISVRSAATKATEDKTTDAIVTTTEVPVWLLNACSALDLLTTEHPKVMTTLSAILITVGSIPAIPAIAGGAGGAILASGAAHAVGAVAVGVGSWIKLQQESRQKILAATESSGSHRRTSPKDGCFYTLFCCNLSFRLLSSPNDPSMISVKATIYPRRQALPGQVRYQRITLL